MLCRQKLDRCYTAPWIAPVHLGGINFSLFAISAILPTTLHFATLFFLFAFSLSKPLLQRPVTTLLERLEAAPNGVFTMIGFACGTLAAILARLGSSK